MPLPAKLFPPTVATWYYYVDSLALRCAPGPLAGPLAYNVSGNVGKQTLSKRENSPTWKLGTGKRFADNEIGSAASVPGPGQYSLPRALGPQITSTKKSLPAVGFGRAPMVRPQVLPAAGVPACCCVEGFWRGACGCTLLLWVST